MKRNIRQIFFGVFLAVVGGLVFVGAAYAHAAYLRSIPAADSVIAVSPPRAEMWFKQEVFRRQGENTIQVSNADGKPVSVGDAIVDDNDRTHLFVDLQAALPPGVYTVDWKNVSLEDGHSTEGSFVFTVDPLAAATSTPISETAVTALPQPTATENAPVQASPTAPAKAAPFNGPCAASMIPLLGWVGFALLRRTRRQLP